METLDKDTATIELLVQGAYHLEGISKVEETAGHTDDFRRIQNDLQRAWDARFEAQRAAATTQARVIHVDVEMDALLLAFGDVVTAADTEKGSKLHATLFPAGVERVVAPVGVLETQAVRGILQRLEKTAGAEALRADWTGPLGDTLGRYEALLEERDMAGAALAQATEKEQAARAAWLEAVGRHLALAAEHYPDSAATRALFLPPGA